jgi:hypothetical protein
MIGTPALAVQHINRCDEPRGGRPDAPVRPAAGLAGINVLGTDDERADAVARAIER